MIIAAVVTATLMALDLHTYKGNSWKLSKNKAKTSIAAPLKTKDKLVLNDGSHGLQNRWALPMQNFFYCELNIGSIQFKLIVPVHKTD